MEQPLIAVVTGTRAEYGLLRPVLQKLAARPDAKLALLATGAASVSAARGHGERDRSGRHAHRGAHPHPL